MTYISIHFFSCFDDSSNATMHTEEVTKNESDMDTNKELWTRYLNENIFATETIHQDRINPFKKINPAETTTNPVIKVFFIIIIT